MIEISPDDLNVPPGVSDETVEALIEEVMAYVRLIAPCVDQLTGNRGIVARSLIVQGLNLRLSPAYSYSNDETIGPFSIKGSASNSIFPQSQAKMLLKLCGKQTGYGVLRLDNGRHGYDDSIWLVDRIR